MELKIAHLYPDVLNYGDRGNILCLTKRLQWRGIGVEVSRVSLGDAAKLSAYDLVYIGGGQEFERQLLLDDLHRGMDREIISAVEDGVPFLAICGGYQLLGNYFEDRDGRRTDYIGALDMHTAAIAGGMVGYLKFQCSPDAGGSVVIGFENHSGETFLGDSVKPLGKVLAGFGNSVRAETEGAHYKNVFGSYGHGPLLPRNPEFCDFILKTALDRKYVRAELAALDNKAELFAHDVLCDIY